MPRSWRATPSACCRDDTGTRPVQLLHPHRRPPAPAATTPDTPPEAPVAVDDVVFAVKTAVRALEMTTTAVGDQTVETWTYQLVDAGTPRVVVHVTSGGESGAAALVALVGPRHRPPQEDDSIGYSVERYEEPDLLIGRQGAATVGSRRRHPTPRAPLVGQAPGPQGPRPPHHPPPERPLPDRR